MMTNTLLAGLSLIDSTGLAILGSTLVTLLLGIITNLALRARYASMEKDIRQVREPDEAFSHPVLDHIVRDAIEAARRSGELNTQAIIEEHFQTELRRSLLAERFVRAATGLAIILGLLGTFYGLSISIGKIVNLVAADPGAAADVTQGVTSGLTQALTGMAVAFSNSLVGILSAVILTVLGILSNVAD
ncbi:MAG TPA: MotA/TolQ/ExbB proton channel family protein, partial [Polyangia bacterium]